MRQKKDQQPEWLPLHQVASFTEKRHLRSQTHTHTQVSLCSTNMAFLIHSNCRGLIHNLGDIQDITHNFSPVVFCLQETNLGSANRRFLKGFLVFRKDREHTSRLSGGVAIIIKNGTPVGHVTLNTSLEAVAVTALSYKTISVCSIYIPPGHSITIRLGGSNSTIAQTISFSWRF